MTPPRILIGSFGLDTHEVGAVAVSRIFRDAKMDVIYAGRYQTPQSLVQAAKDARLDIIGISCHSWEYLEYFPELIEALKNEGLDVPVIAGGSVITPKDGDKLRSLGVAAVFGPGSKPESMVEGVRALVAQRRNRVGSD